jgi:hypothetical protein
MIVVKLFSYPNIIELQIFDPAIYTTRNAIVYSRQIKVYQGIDNPIQVIVKNQDQKLVDLTGYTVEAAIQDPTNLVTVNTYPITFSNIAAGQGNFTLDSATISSLEQRFYKLTFKLIHTLDSTESPMYIDTDYGVPLDLQILPAYLT